MDVVVPDLEQVEGAAGNTVGQNWYVSLWHCWMKYWKWLGIWIRTRENYLRRLLL